MTNPKARAVAERLTLLTANPEVTAMAAICEILQELPDDAARLRVMHWSFGRFNPEFKRPVASAPAPQPTPAPVVPAPAPLVAAPATLTSEIAAVAPDLTGDAAAIGARRDEDFGTQLSELRDLFSTEGSTPPRRPIYADAF
jgi:hypothetical protein